MLALLWLSRAKRSSTWLSHTRGAQLCLAAGAMLCALNAAPASAQHTTIGGDLDLNVPINSSHESSGGGFGIRLGEEFHLPLVAVNPEIGFTYAGLTADSGYHGPLIYRGIIGGRVGIGELIRFGLLAHLGFGHISWRQPAIPPESIDLSHTGFTYDVGLFLELTALPLLNVGVHAIYNHVTEKENIDSVQWLQLGAHVTLVL